MRREYSRYPTHQTHSLNTARTMHGSCLFLQGTDVRKILNLMFGEGTGVLDLDPKSDFLVVVSYF